MRRRLGARPTLSGIDTRARYSRPLATMSAAACVGRKSAVDEEDASELRLGPDFNEANRPSLAEVKIRSSGTTTGKGGGDVDDAHESVREDAGVRAEIQWEHHGRCDERHQKFTRRRGLHDFEGAVISNLTPQDGGRGEA